MYKYLMVNPEDYRPDNKNHEVLQVKEENGVCYAYGYFTTLTEDMVKVTDEELSTEEINILFTEKALIL